MDEWSPLAKIYDPLKCGSIDGTDTVPHDKAVIRAMNAKCMFEEISKLDYVKYWYLFVYAQ